MKKRQLAAGLFAALAMTVLAQSNEWKNPGVNQVNRLPMHSAYFAYENADMAAKGMMEKSTNYMTLNGTWKFNWVKDSDARPTDFWKTDYNDKGWATMPVPGIWELNGYGDPLYVNTGYAWREQFENNPPEVPVKENHVGSYRKEITIPASWNGKQIIAHFGSVTSNIYLWVNGRYVGYSEDSKLETEFDLTPFVKPGQKNLVAFQVFRWCDGTYLEDQDFFRFSGVARDSYLYARNKQQISDIRVKTDLDEKFVNATLGVELTSKGGGTVELSLIDASGKQVASETTKLTGKNEVQMSVPSVNKWSAETPYLYTLNATLKNGSEVIEVIPVKVGFRKIELKNSQILINGQAVLFKGADRHELDPDGGYVMSRERMIQDIQLMKKFNLNAVRTCHYPDDNTWYDLCDQYGLYMVAEANLESHGMGYGDKTLAKNDAFRQAHLERNQRNVQRNFNHPAVIFWSLGNEAGYGPNFEAAYDWVKAEDPSRAVQYERAEYDGKTDIHCPMYLNYKNCIKYCEDDSKTKPLILCEYAHAMGNSEGGFKEYWDLVRKYPKYQGGFIWDFVDQSVRWNKNGKTVYGYGGDFNDYDASDQNFCDNGLVSPDRVPNPHMYEVGYFYQNIWTTPVDMSTGKIQIYNENFFRDLSAYYMEWEVLHNGKIERTGRVDNLNVGPQQKTTIDLAYGDFCKNCEWHLNVAYKLKNAEGLLPAGYVVARDQIEMSPYKGSSMSLGNVKLVNVEPTAAQLIDNDHKFVIVSGDNFRMEFDRKTGMMVKYELDGQTILKEGESLTPNFWRAPTDNDFGANLQRRYAVWKQPEMKLKSLTKQVKDWQVIVEAAYELPAVEGKLTLTYQINNVGAVKITQKLNAGKKEKVANLFRFGMKLPMPKSFENIEYYGRGPIENYQDRNHSTFLGVYHQTVSDQFYSYIRPQENGNKTDIRYWILTEKSGKGIKIVADAPFSASALHYTVESLDEGLTKHQMHSEEVEESDLTNMLIDKVQMGLGCVNSWGTIAEPQYLLPYQDYEFSFIISPIKNSLVKE